MILCTRCNNETWLSELVTEQGPVMLAGPRGSAPQPIAARVCTACGHIELYGPQPVADAAAVTAPNAAAGSEPENVPAPAA